jgi:hypothetical protein
MEQRIQNITITKNSEIRVVLNALNAGSTIEELSSQCGIDKRTLEDKIYNAGIEKDESGKYFAITEASLGKILKTKIYNVRNKSVKSESIVKEEQGFNFEQLNKEIRYFMIKDREKAKQYTPSKEVWHQVKTLQKYLFNVQQDWLLDALISVGINSIQLPEDLKELMDTKEM